MNLIEQLGGYDFVKSKSDSDILYGEKIYLKRALLEYRRQNNIFEVEDKVITLIGKVSYIYTVEQIDNDGSITIVRRPKPTQPHWTIKNASDIRHATDKEIAQGFRDED